jgi:hypothetical protein
MFTCGPVRYNPPTCPKKVGDLCPPVELPVFLSIEMVTVIIFTIDYLIRMLTVHAVPIE